MKSRIIVFLLLIAAIAAPAFAQAPHTLQVDDGSGNITTLSATAGSSSDYTFPPGSGTVMTNTNVSTYAWSVNGNSMLPAQFIGSTNNSDVVVKAYGNEQLKIRASGGIELPATTNTGTGAVYQAGISIMQTYGSNNIFTGANAGNFSISGDNNAACGAGALSNVTSGAGNTATGAQAGLANGSGSNNTFIGRAADANASDLVNATAIGANAIVGQSNTVVLGNNASVGIGTSTPGEMLEVNGNVRISGVNGLKITEGANGTMGIATLVAGTVVVNTTKVTANSRIFLTIQNPNGGAVGSPYVAVRGVGTFTINSTNAADVSDVAWVIIEP